MKTLRNADSLLGARWRSGLFVSAGVILLAASSCAQLIGTEKRTEGDLDGSGSIDEETGIRTSKLCIEYCLEVLGNCEDENAVYKAHASCINTCNSLPDGEAAEPVGNTIECRLQKAKSAEDDPDEHCIAAGPGGGESCGSNCESWCHLLEVECESDFDKMVDCRASCESIDDDGSFDVDASYARDDIQCRLIHLGAVGGVSFEHCGHARYIAEDLCVPAEEGEATCADYCDTSLANCQGDLASYESRSECMAACESVPLGELSDRSENSVGCRIYHSRAAASDPGPHCKHSGPTGDGTCGGDSGNCESYCRLLQSACNDDFSGDFGDLDDCVESCGDDFADKGADKGSGYSVKTATDEDSLQCRVYYAVKAADGEEDACEKARLQGSCD